MIRLLPLFSDGLTAGCRLPTNKKIDCLLLRRIYVYPEPGQKILRPSDSAFHAVPHRTMGTFLVLRDAGHPDDLSILRRERRWVGYRQNAGRRHRRRIRRQRLPIHHPRRVVGRPDFRGGKNAVYLRHRRDARPHPAGRHPRPVRPAVWPGVHRLGQRRRKVVGQLHGRFAV